MEKLQLRVLYREFLFRMVDLELLSSQAQGDMSKLFGQFAALLLFVSAMAILGHPAVHFFLSTTMLAVGLFSVLSWDSAFPDRRDVLVLAPLPVRARTLFLAKVAALAVSLSWTVGALNACTGLMWPLSLGPPGSGLFGIGRAFVAYWIAMFAGGTFVFCAVLAVQGLAAQVFPRRVFLRVSAFLQIAAFCLILCGYFLEPGRPKPAWPTYWFLALFHQLNGSTAPGLNGLAGRAWAGLAAAMLGAATALLLSYFRTLRRIVEEPDIAPGARGWRWLPPFGNALQTAVAHFSIRTLLRSRQHRMILSFYLGVGFALVILVSRDPGPRPPSMGPGQISPAVLLSSVVMLCFWVLGARIVFAMPLELRANWIFRVAPIAGPPACLAATRRSLLALAIAPVWAGSAVLLFSVAPWRPAAGHLALLAMVGSILVDVLLLGFRKIPFTCSYLPGKSNVHLRFLGFVWLGAGLLIQVILFEQRMLAEPATFFRMAAVLMLIAVAARWITTRAFHTGSAPLLFEESLPPTVQTLNLSRDGVIPMS